MAEWVKFSRAFLAAVMGVAMFFAGPARAGDRALYELIGYSEDMGYFAFEEFGIQDGSGFAYSNIYVVDIDNDRWVVGTPIQIQAENETEKLPAIRKEARDAAANFISALAITRPAQLLAANGDGALNGNGKILNFGLPGFSGPESVAGRFELSLATFPAESGAPCMEWSGQESLGFALSLEAEGVAREVHRDEKLPRSRQCPQTYTISAVVMPFENRDIDRAVALISVYRLGFEGPDRRFIAQPLAAAFSGR